MKETIILWLKVCFLLFFVGVYCNTAAWATDDRWMQKGVRVWYLGGVDSGGSISSNAEEAYLLDAVNSNNVQVIHHSALDHWTSSKPVETVTYQRNDKGPCWIHPITLQNLKAGDYWMGQELTLVTTTAYTYDTFPYKLLPIKALFDLKTPRNVVKLAYMIPGGLVGNAYFDSDTGLLLYYHTLWGSSKMFFMFSEINYNFADRTAFAEDDGPHTGFKSFVSEQSMGDYIGSGLGGSVIIQSLVETRYGNTVEMRVLSSLTGAYGAVAQGDHNYCFFGDDPILRFLDAAQAPNYPPEQWTACGQYLWWWIPNTGLAKSTINVLDAPMTRTAVNPYVFTASQAMTTFYFSVSWLGNDGYLAQFSAKDPRIFLDVDPADFNFQNNTMVYGLDYYRNTMGNAVPANPAALTMPAILGLLLCSIKKLISVKPIIKAGSRIRYGCGGTNPWKILKPAFDDGERCFPAGNGYKKAIGGRYLIECGMQVMRSILLCPSGRFPISERLYH